MNQTIKNVQGLALTVALLVVAGAVWKYAESYAFSIEPSSFRSFSVSAEGKVVGVPDVAQFTFSVITEGGKDLSALQEQNTKKMNDAISFLKSKSIDPKDIKTKEYSVEPRYQYYSCPEHGGACPPPIIVGYVIKQSVLVKIRNFENIGDVLSAIAERGANSVSQLNFTVDDPTSLENSARKEAIKKAQIKAKEIASAGGFGVGRLLGIDEGSQPIPYYRASFSKSEALGSGGSDLDSAPSPSIEPGSRDITVNVTLQYEIQ